MAVEFERYPSPLRYPGGKARLANFVKLLMLRNRLIGTEYVEPYAGGASIALSLLFEEYASHIHINDLNRSVYVFWRCVLNDTEALCSRITDARFDVDEWDKQRAVQSEPDPSELDLAFSTFFLNRTSRSGIISHSGIIGGRRQAGTWKIDARFNRDDLVRRIKRIGRFRSRITVTRLDAKDYLLQSLPAIGDDCFVYLDPPYYVKGSDLYENFYKHEHHAEIAQLVRQLEVPWVVSYDDVPEIRELYSGFRSSRYSLRYTAARRYAGAETMFYQPDLRTPRVGSVAAVTAEQVAAAC
ncbi:MAG: DNA adenine methylase [Actinomycetota bacterium]|nr:DNA adenine methylase [Actinomycetota bacterium]